MKLRKPVCFDHGATNHDIMRPTRHRELMDPVVGSSETDETAFRSLVLPLLASRVVARPQKSLDMVFRYRVR
jgi:hypothetical protein